MSKISIILITAFIFHFQSDAQTKINQIDSLLNAAFDNREFTGSVLIIHQGKAIIDKAYGYRDVQSKLPNTPGTIYNIASITKTFTAALILKLQENNKLSIDNRLSQFYAGFPNGDRITIRHLLTHTSGIPDYVQDPLFRNSDQSKPVKLESMISYFINKPLNFDPGTRFAYSNSGYTMLGYIIEKVTGLDFRSALSQYIFNPLKMKSTSFGPPEDTLNLAKGYGMYFKNFQRLVPPVDPSISYATGAIYSATGDLYKWHQAMQGESFLKKESIKQMYTRDRGNYGFGWFTDSLYSYQRVSHDGSIQGYKSNINRFPTDNTCVIALSNSNNSGVGALVRNIVNILYNRELAKTFMEAPVTKLSDSILKVYTGRYHYGNAIQDTVAVILKNNQLILRLPGSADMQLEAINPNQFRSDSTRIEFSGQAKGIISQIMVFKKGEFLGAQKQQ